MAPPLVPTISCNQYLQCSQSARQLAAGADSLEQKAKLLQSLHPLRTSSRLCPDADSLIRCELQRGKIAASIHYSVWSLLGRDPLLKNDAQIHDAAKVLAETASQLAFAYYNFLQVRFFYRAQGGPSKEVYSSASLSDTLARLLPDDQTASIHVRLWRVHLRTPLMHGEVEGPLQLLRSVSRSDPSSNHDPAEIERSALAIALVARERSRTASFVSERIGYESVLIQALEQAWLSTMSEASRHRYESVRMLAQMGLRLDFGAPLPIELVCAPGESPEAFSARATGPTRLLSPVLFQSDASI